MINVSCHAWIAEIRKLQIKSFSPGSLLLAGYKGKGKNG